VLNRPAAVRRIDPDTAKAVEALGTAGASRRMAWAPVADGAPFVCETRCDLVVAFS